MRILRELLAKGGIVGSTNQGAYLKLVVINFLIFHVDAVDGNCMCDVSSGSRRASFRQACDSALAYLCLMAVDLMLMRSVLYRIRVFRRSNSVGCRVRNQLGEAASRMNLTSRLV